VDEMNAAARGLYNDEDFAEVGRRPDYYRAAGGERSNALVLCRELFPTLTDDLCRGF
jgi:ribosomal-protein-alanine N-acetyltransferase